MQTNTRLYFFLLWLVVGGTSYAEANKADQQGIIWQGDPIHVQLKPKQELRINFPEPIVELDVPEALEQSSQIVLTPTGELFWTANGEFRKTRVLATSVSGVLYQFDVETHPRRQTQSPLTIIDPVLLQTTPQPPTQRALNEAAAEAIIPSFLKNNGAGQSRQAANSFVKLSRFAFSHYAGPQRLIPNIGATQVEVRSVPNTELLRGLISALSVRPLAQWQVADRYVTALGVFNKSTQSISFDPRVLRGNFLFAASLKPQLRSKSGTVWTVISTKPFNEAIR